MTQCDFIHLSFAMICHKNKYVTIILDIRCLFCSTPPLITIQLNVYLRNYRIGLFCKWLPPHSASITMVQCSDFMVLTVSWTWQQNGTLLFFWMCETYNH